LAKGKELISKVRESDADINARTAGMIALLAIQQAEPSFAMEILGAVRVQNLTTVQNIRVCLVFVFFGEGKFCFLKAICYAEMGRVEEAINVIHLLAEQTPFNSDRRRVFPLVVRTIYI
jgi:hypothetical protein